MSPSPTTRAPLRRAEIVIDLAAIRNNVARLREHVRTPLMAVVKADGYGHGLVEAGRAAREGGAEWLGVASADEALALRAAGDTGRLLAWLIMPSEPAEELIAADIDVTAYTIADLEKFAAAGDALGSIPRVQLKIDTGLSRGGSSFAEWTNMVARARILEAEGAIRVTGIWSHFASSEDPDDPANESQEKVFAEALAIAADAGLRPEVRHLANSAGALLRPGARFDLVRVGIATYGIDPAPGVGGSPWPELGLVPAMTVRAELAMVKQIEAGAGVSYNHTWVAEEPTTVGVVPAGYAEGIQRSAGNRAEVWVDGARRPVRGTVCMDQVVIDLGSDEVEPGSEVVLWGTGADGEPTAQDWAEASGTIAYEVVTRIGGRMKRRHVDTEQEGADR
ncbi:alanine racemase [Nocardioides luteus]|uniref:alanine racemase n=1 Tax=Nocardioides luteus TaxID=1844 RepID=UPI00166375F1|nr:alanine racemase [Nocardioides luteus]MDR7313751.1 alanine racemase [Nocardioides luteus]GGR63617.1 alanine racemase [Nocardioides luteus]